jgi:hypothetical protein
MGVSNGGGTILILLSIEKRSPTSFGTVAMRSKVATRKSTLKKCGTVRAAEAIVDGAVVSFSVRVSTRI